MNKYVRSYGDLITSHEQTRAGFIEAALEKNKKAAPFIEAAKTLKTFASTVSDPHQLLTLTNIRSGLLSASGLSDKALKYFNDEDKEVAIKELIDKFLVPAGEYFVDELVYRFLLIKGDSLGGSMRNFVGSVAKIKVTRKILSVLSTMGIDYQVIKKDSKQTNQWNSQNYEKDFEDAIDIAAIAWSIGGRNRVVFFDTKVPIVNKNIDICLFEGTPLSYSGGDIVNHPEKAIMLGELKGGIDPAGADEHWKTGNSALQRIRDAFDTKIKTSFVAAAIETNMAKEIYEQMENGILTNAANLTVENQFTDYCEWIVTL